MSERLDRLQQRHAVIGFPLAVLYKFFDDMAGFLVALIAYYAFLSFFPLLLVLATIVRIVLESRPDLQRTVLDSALSEIPLIGDQLNPTGVSGGTAAIIITVLIAIYGGLGVGQAFQYAMNSIWGVPRNRRPNPFRSRARSFVLLLIVLLFVLLTSALSAIGSGGLVDLGSGTPWLYTIAAFLITLLVFALGMRRAVARDVAFRDVLCGAIGAALTWQLLQTFGFRIVARAVEGASASGGVFAIVIGLFAFLHLAALGIMLSAEVDVVRVERLWPRALLTIFTDDVELTDADRRAYARQARAYRFKEYQHIDVDWGRPPRDDAERAGQG